MIICVVKIFFVQFFYTERRWRQRQRAGTISAAESYPTSKVKDSGPECQAAMVQELLGGATLCPRSVAAGKRHPMFKVRGRQEKPPHIRGQGQ